MPAVALELKRRQHAVAYDGIVAWLQRDPALKRVVKVWKSWDGSDDADTPVGSDDTVQVQITPSLGPSSRFSPNADGSWVFYRPLILKIEAFIPTQAASQAMQLSDAIGSRMTPTGDTSAEFDLKLAEWCVMEVLEVQACDLAETYTNGSKVVGRYQLEMHF